MDTPDVARIAERAREAATARARHGVHARGPLPAAALPRPGRGRRGGLGARSAGGLRTGAARRRAGRSGDRDRGPRRPSGRRDPAPRVGDRRDERVRHAGGGGLRRLLGPGRLQRPAPRRAEDPAAEDGELHALGRAAADRRAAALRARGRRAPAAAGRRHPLAAGGERPARVGARGVPRDRAWPPTSATRRRSGGGCRGPPGSIRASARSRASWAPGASARPSARTGRSAPCCATRR